MERKTIDQLAKEALLELERQCYAKVSKRNNRMAFARIVRFAARTGELYISDEMVRRYLLCCYGWDMDSDTKPSAHISYQLRAANVLKWFEKYGCIPGRAFRPIEPPACFLGHFDQYISDCNERGLSRSTIEIRSRDICDFLTFAKDNGVLNIAEIDTGLLDEYLFFRNSKAPKAMRRILSSLRCFLRSMFMYNIIQRDLSLSMPPGSRYPVKPVQKIWTQEEIEDLLGFVDKSDSIGKRDYAFMLLVVRYGMRAGDIINLKLTDINWESMTIQLQQKKTSVMNVLPILDDVGWALADWITNARPKQASTNHLFTRMTAPYCGMININSRFSKHMVNAGISKHGCGNAGPHSLRHALASNMLGSQIPLPVITAVLGHSSSASTTVYLHSDIEGLRQCALDVEEVDNE